MDKNPAFPLSLMYRNDPIYSLCASDLMTASQRVNNNFIKEQKQLIKTLNKLQQQKVTRMRQLNEEKKQFAFLMKKKLSPRGIGLTTAWGTSPVRVEKSVPSELSSASRFSVGTGSRGISAVSVSGESSYVRNLPRSQILHREHQDAQRVSGLNEYTTSTRCVCECGHSSKWLTRSESCLPVIQRYTAMAGVSSEFTGHSRGYKMGRNCS